MKDTVKKKQMHEKEFEHGIWTLNQFTLSMLNAFGQNANNTINIYRGYILI